MAAAALMHVAGTEPDEVAQQVEELCTFVESVEQQQYDLRRCLAKVTELVADVEADAWDSQTLEELRNTLSLQAKLEQKHLAEQVGSLQRSLADAQVEARQNADRCRELELALDGSREQIRQLSGKLELAEDTLRSSAEARRLSLSSAGGGADASAGIVSAVMGSVNVALDQRHEQLISELEQRLDTVQASMQQRLDSLTLALREQMRDRDCRGEDAKAGLRPAGAPGVSSRALWVHSLAVAVVAAAVSVFLPSYLNKSGFM